MSKAKEKINKGGAKNLTVNNPVANQATWVRTGQIRVNRKLEEDPHILCDCTGTICATGTANKQGVGPAIKVYARIYRSTEIPQGGVPSQPPMNDALVIAVPPFLGANYRFIQESAGANNEIPNALGNIASPHGDNKLVIWAEYSDGSWDPPAETDFLGLCNTGTFCQP